MEYEKASKVKTEQLNKLQVAQFAHHFIQRSQSQNSDYQQNKDEIDVQNKEQRSLYLKSYLKYKFAMDNVDPDSEEAKPAMRKFEEEYYLNTD